MIIIPTKQDLNKNHNDSPKGDKNNRHIIPMKLQGVIRIGFDYPPRKVSQGSGKFACTITFI